MKGQPPRSPRESEALESARVVSQQLRAAVVRDLNPSAGDRARLRAGLMAAIATGSVPATVQRVDAAMGAHGTGAAGVKATALGHALATKWIVAGLAVAGSVGVVATMLPRQNEARTAQRAPQAAPLAPRELAPPPAAKPTDAPSAPATALEPVPRSRPATPSLAAHAAPRAAHAARPAHAASEPPLATPAASTSEALAQPTAAATPERNPEPEAPQVASAPLPPRAAEPVSPPQPVPQHDLKAELALIRAASSALERGDTRAALAALAEHRRRYPRAALRLEADALQAITLCAAHSGEAPAASAAFLREHANSPLAERVRRACAKAP